ncbi:hypothetical protein OIV83_004981 [Microbotryomycetes sp. JL201]|nr:hypothetical protein OIV83_004981 [Microbotryomycetes sp. JL201]
MTSSHGGRHKDPIQLKATEAAGKSRLTGSAPPPPGLAINYNLDYTQSAKTQDRGLYQAPKPSQTRARPVKASSRSAPEIARAVADSIKLACGQQDDDEATAAATRRDKPFQPAFDAEADVSNRVESVFDLYADMTSGDEDESRSHVASEPIIEEEPEDENAGDEPKHNVDNPWDTRGETGLYGGGGRGADDRETGWVSNYAIQAAGGRTTGLEEDLRFTDEDGGADHSRTERLDSAATYRAQDRRRSSEETEQSSYEPKTPVTAAFPTTQVYVPSDYMPSSPTRSGAMPEPKTPESRKEDRRRFQVSKPSPANVKESISPPLSPGFEHDLRTRQQAQMPAQRTGFKAKFAPSKSTSAGLHIKHPHPLPDTPPQAPVHKVDSALLSKSQPETPSPARRKSFRWTGRSKKTPQISAPILPEGFVESLGMETVPLTPGMKAPAAGAINMPQTPPITPNGAGQRSPSGAGSHTGSDHQSPASSIRSAGNKINRKEAPRPQRIPNRPNYVPPRPMQLGDPIELSPAVGPRSSTPSNSEAIPQPQRPLASPIRLGPSARPNLVGGETDARNGFRNAPNSSVQSESSATKSLAAIAQTRKLYLNGVKEERARQEASLSPVPSSTSVQRPQVSPSDSSLLPSNSPLATPTKADANGFRNPWGAPVSVPPSSIAQQQHGEGIRDSVATSISSSDHFGTAHTTNVFHPTGSNRKQSATSSSSRNTVDPRMYRATTTPSGYSASDLAHLKCQSVDDDEDEQDQESKRGRDARRSNISGVTTDYSSNAEYDHRNSTSSAYSDLSNFDDYPDLDNYAHNFGSSSDVKIGDSVAPKRGSRTSRGSAGADSFSHLRSTQPLNLSKKPLPSTNEFSNQQHQSASSTSAPRFATTSGSAIGNTGFTNPFG